MRLWSLHPRYLDAKGLVALWREALLAQHVLLGKTKGYKHHPQLFRFREQADPTEAMSVYLREVVAEAEKRGYSFDSRKIALSEASPDPITVTDGQLAYEWEHLRKKLEARDPATLACWKDVKQPEIHPLFTLTKGPIADWERPRRHCERSEAIHLAGCSAWIASASPRNDVSRHPSRAWLLSCRKARPWPC